MLATVLAACGTTTTVTPIGPARAPKHESCEVEIAKTSQELPPNRELLAKIESHIQRNIFFGGKVTLIDDAYKELRLKACLLGGDTVLVDDYLESDAAEMTHLHVWASVFRKSK